MLSGGSQRVTNPNCTHPPEFVMYVEALGCNKCRLCGKRLTGNASIKK